MFPLGVLPLRLCNSEYTCHQLTVSGDDIGTMQADEESQFVSFFVCVCRLIQFCYVLCCSRMIPSTHRCSSSVRHLLLLSFTIFLIHCNFVLAVFLEVVPGCVGTMFRAVAVYTVHVRLYIFHFSFLCLVAIYSSYSNLWHSLSKPLLARIQLWAAGTQTTGKPRVVREIQNGTTRPARQTNGKTSKQMLPAVLVSNNQVLLRIGMLLIIGFFCLEQIRSYHHWLFYLATIRSYHAFRLLEAHFIFIWSRTCVDKEAFWWFPRSTSEHSYLKSYSAQGWHTKRW